MREIQNFHKEKTRMINILKQTWNVKRKVILLLLLLLLHSFRDAVVSIPFLDYNLILRNRK